MFSLWCVLHRVATGHKPQFFLVAPLPLPTPLVLGWCVVLGVFVGCVGFCSFVPITPIAATNHTHTATSTEFLETVQTMCTGSHKSTKLGGTLLESLGKPCTKSDAHPLTHRPTCHTTPCHATPCHSMPCQPCHAIWQGVRVWGALGEMCAEVRNHSTRPEKPQNTERKTQRKTRITHKNVPNGQMLGGQRPPSGWESKRPQGPRTTRRVVMQLGVENTSRG